MLLLCNDAVEGALGWELHAIAPLREDNSVEA